MPAARPGLARLGPSTSTAGLDLSLCIYTCANMIFSGVGAGLCVRMGRNPAFKELLWLLDQPG